MKIFWVKASGIRVRHLPHLQCAMRPSFSDVVGIFRIVHHPRLIRMLDAGFAYEV
jgi:hypothetical protein